MLDGVDFREALIDFTQLAHVKSLRNTQLTLPRVSKKNRVLQNIDFTLVKFEPKNHQAESVAHFNKGFSRYQLRGVNFQRAELPHNFYRSKLLFVHFEGAKLFYDNPGKNNKRFNFAKALLVACHFGSCFLQVCNFSQANFSDAKLRSVGFQRANLVDADFSFSCLTHISFSEAILTGAKFTGAELSFVDFSYAIEKQIDYFNVTTGAAFNASNLLEAQSLQYVRIERLNASTLSL